MAENSGDSSRTLVEKGKLKYYRDDILQKATDYTIYRGWYEGRVPVAIKRFEKERWSLEFIDRHRESDRHENIARYYVTEEDEDFFYIGIELWTATLEDLIRGRYKDSSVGSDKEIVLQIARAVEYLSDRNIVLRNITPETILISESDGGNPPRIILEDFSVSRKMREGEADRSNSGSLQGNQWTAPELLRVSSRYSTAADVFSTGCVFAYFLSRGKHPFGTRLDQLANILSETIDWPEEIADQSAKDFITNMIRNDPNNRIAMNEVLIHPYFWDEKKCLDFIEETCTAIEMDDANRGSLRQSLEVGKGDVFDGEWPDRMSDEARNNLFTGRFAMRTDTQTKTSLFFLLKAIRNKLVHFNELSEEAKAEFGQPPEAYFRYWAGKFPRLLVYTWNVMKEVKKDPNMKRFYTKA